ncbi:helix-turn-helix domain-containing protein [Natrarchaeobaculum sulfurireducens]|uniref:Bacterio-opsin activator domain-containingprotein n=1 Tax=Natrarchaeobaculum sulfurireducens TaxID=2044521 RepID=A0A346PPI8_9EURY|nr:helix-turn-helix domain-containing protein [Natrarchaeobaculum sulfurireducens]AXR78513.1 Transcriptional regulator, contains HTH domain [Natrarchaeobaculum sulfurireducens]AXR81433.1 Bacterio-opsin activator domain-containingprotein [Natrarchaeobaculum sulfurireducens]
MTELEPKPDLLHVSLLVSEIESAHEVLRHLDEMGGTVHPDSLEVTDAVDAKTQVDVSDLTVKQWQALELAYRWGYYDQPRKADLADLATELEISKSAVSQRLRAAESTLVTAIVTASR